MRKIFIVLASLLGVITSTWAAENVVSDHPVLYSGVSGPYLDASGQIETRIHWATTYGTKNKIRIYVAPDEVLIGGGAYISEAGSTNALLRSSYPYFHGSWYDATIDDDQYYALSWCAESLDHPSGDTEMHWLTVQAVGMKLKSSIHVGSYVPQADVLKKLRYTWAASGRAAHPSATVSPIPGFDIVSGGARVIDFAGMTTGNFANTAGNYLTESMGIYNPSTNRLDGWRASSKDHIFSCPTSIIAYAICLPKNNGWDDFPGYDYYGNYREASIPEFGNFNFTIRDSSNTALVTWGWNAARVAPSFINTTPDSNGILQLTMPYRELNNFYNDSWNPYLEQQSGKNVVYSLVGVGAKASYNGSGRLLSSVSFNDGNYSASIQDKDYIYWDSGTLYGQQILIVKDTGTGNWWYPGMQGN